MSSSNHHYLLLLRRQVQWQRKLADITLTSVGTLLHSYAIFFLKTRPRTRTHFVSFLLCLNRQIEHTENRHSNHCLIFYFTKMCFSVSKVRNMVPARVKVRPSCDSAFRALAGYTAVVVVSLSC